MKKKLAIMLCVMLCLMLSSCMKMNMSMDVDNEGKVTASLKVLVSKEMIDSYGSEEDLYKNVKDEDYKKITETIDGTKYVGYEVSEQKSDEALAKVEGDEVTVTLPMSSFKDYGMDASTLKGSGYSLDQLKKLGMEMTLVVNMPGDAKSNVGTVKGNSVTIDLLKLSVESPDEDIVISSKVSSGNTILYVGIGAAVLIVIIVVAVVLGKKKKNGQTDAAPAEDAPPVIDIPEADVKPVDADEPVNNEPSKE